MVKSIDLHNQKLRLMFDCDCGEFQLVYVPTDTVIMRGAHSSIKLEDGSEWRTAGNTYVSSHVKDGSLNVVHKFGADVTLIQQFALEPDWEHFLMKLIIVNDGALSLRVNSMRTIVLSDGGWLKLGPDPSQYHVYTNPYYKTPASVRDVFDGFNSQLYQQGHTNGIEYLNREFVTPWHSTFDGVIYDPTGKQSAVFGFTTCERFLPQIEFNYNKKQDGDGIGTFSMINRCEGRICRPMGVLESEMSYFYTGFSAEEGQETFAKLTGGAMKAVRLDHPMSGWCSWHYSFFDITEDDIERNLSFAAEHPEVFTPEDGGFEYVLIDYGWQKTIGAPQVNTVQFPRGMKRLADMIRQKGFKPGIWIAPFWIEADAEIVETHPEYLLHHVNGELVKGPGTFQHPSSYRLDISHPGARQYVLDQLDQLIHEWGYDLIKMDFLEMSTVSLMENPTDFRYYSDELTSIEHLRSICIEMQQLVDRSGKDVWLSPCGSPTLALCGIFKSNFVAEDAIIRFLPDKINMHGGVKVFAETLALRRYLHHNIWTNNYESVILRKPRTYKEARINVTSAGLSGGILFIGDDLSLLEADRLHLFSKMLPIYPIQARPLDLYDKNFSEQWLLKVETPFDQWWVAALFNWDDSEQDMDLRFPDDGPALSRHYRVFDFWEQREMGIAKGGITIQQISPADCKVLCIREYRQYPWLLSTDYHLTQGGVEIGDLQWDEENRLLQGRFTGRKHGTACLTFSVNSSYEFESYECTHASIETSAGHVQLNLENLDGSDRNFKLFFNKI